jgi:ATP-dependent RNA helicase RhlE
MPFKTFGLSDPLVRGILAVGYIAPTEIQSKAIPLAIEGKDIIGCAQTGTGKTAAFVLPILNRLSHEKTAARKVIKSLIITPTRELAAQIEEAIHGYGRFLHVSTVAIYGGVSIKNQLNALRHGVDIVVATPGRLMDHIQRRSVDLRHIEVLVLDEADRMMDMGFINDVRKIVAALPKKRQTMFFSATVSPEIKAVAAGMLKSPEMIQIGRPRNPIETIRQHVYPVRKEQKMDVLLHMLSNSRMESVLVFSRTKHGADRINKRLKTAGIVSVAIHSDRTQNQRLLALDGFKSGKYQVMVATDIAARGIDVTGISHVINYDVPVYAEDYVHRIGRTGRAEATGDAITFVSHDEEEHLRKIERFIGRELKFEKYKDFTYSKPVSPHPQPAGKQPSGMQRGRSRDRGRRSNRRRF